MQAISGAVLGSELEVDAERLRILTRRVQGEADSQPKISSSGWSGPASWACDIALQALNRELESAIDLLRRSAALTATAASEASRHA